MAGPALYFIGASIPIFWLLVIAFEMRVFDRCSEKRESKKEQEANDKYENNVRGQFHRLDTGSLQQFIPFLEETDVTVEEKRVQGLKPEELPVRVNKIKKTYGKVTAVDRVSFGLEYGECFALLGVSGAGKTNCFKCLTGEIYPTKGDVTVNGFDVTTSKGFQNARKQLGYCP